MEVHSFLCIMEGGWRSCVSSDQLKERKTNIEKNLNIKGGREKERRQTFHILNEIKRGWPSLVRVRTFLHLLTLLVQCTSVTLINSLFKSWNS